MAENMPMAHLHSEQPNNEANSVLQVEDIKSHSAPPSQRSLVDQLMLVQIAE